MLNLGIVDNEAGRFERAAPVLHGALGILAGLDRSDPYNEARARIEFGRALGEIGNNDAVTQLALAVEQMREVGSDRGVAQALHRLGEHAWRMRCTDEARRHLTESVRLYRLTAETEAGQVQQLLDSVPADLV